MRLVIATLALAAGCMPAQAQCQFFLANQTGGNQGFSLHLDAPADSKGACALSSTSLVLTVGDGAGYHHAIANPSWQAGVAYTAEAIINASGLQQLSLNGQSSASVQAAFQPASGSLFGSEDGSTQSATPGYVITEISLQVSNGSNSALIDPEGSNPTPLPLVLMAGGGTLWPMPFSDDPKQPTIVTATFRFDPAISNPHQFDPYVDGYGQTTFASWGSKVNTDSDLQAALSEEQAWRANNGPLGGTDAYGGSLLAGWTDKATGYFHTVFHSNRWWLISPLGNPLFYIGLSGIYEDATPTTGRESMFSGLPAQSGEFAPAYGQNVYGDAQNTTYVSFATANLIRKYGSSWRTAKNTVTFERLASWGFAGSGKWTHPQPGLTVNPVLTHDSVPNVVANGHPDVFDANIVGQLKATLAQQIGSDATNAYIIGWSVGNETAEIVASGEVNSILALGPSAPAKRALVDHALSAIYGSSVSALATAWMVTAATVADVYAAKPTAPSKDVETLRQYYEQTYYSTIYRTVKSIDPNHLYLGNWILGRQYPADWPIIAANCDVVGMDLYAPAFPEPDVVALISGTGRPVLIGEFSYPSAYAGLRAFGSNKYMGEITLSDSASGDLYAQWLHDASANPFVVGVEWFDYRDEPISGRGNNNGVGNISSSLVIGENFAFGMVDIADRPKYDLVNKVRAGNVATLAGLGMLGSAPVLTSAPANGATYTAGGLVPGSWAQVKGTNLADPGVTRIWQNSDFAGLQNGLPTDLSGVQVLVNGVAAAVYYVSPTQVSFQMTSGVSGTASVQVTRDGVSSNAMTAQVVASAPGIFPIILGNTNYAAAVFLDGKIAADPANGPAFRNAVPGDTVQLFATGLAPSPAGTVVSPASLVGVTVTIGTVTVPAIATALVAVGEFQINFTVPRDFASLPPGPYPISISINGVSSPTTINSSPPAPVVIPIQH